jgi:hypothetical protein
MVYLRHYFNCSTFSWLSLCSVTLLIMAFCLSRMAIKGGVMALSISWNCNLDRDFEKYCLPKYGFRILDNFGWNFRHAKYHEEHRRSLFKMYGIKVSACTPKQD